MLRTLWKPSYTCRLNSVVRPCSRDRRKVHSYAYPPLRILYCGSDEFSSYILERLDGQRQNNSSLISSIEVVNKQGKRAGRGLKTVRQTPCMEKAVTLGLKHYEIATFTGWTPPPADLVIAVSFGLLVPPRILESAKYGGLNVHPSLLPDLWGPAPLHHTLLEGRDRTGVTLQTLHPKHFDQGRLIDSVSFDLPNKGNVTFNRLLDMSMHAGADLLIKALLGGTFLATAGQDQMLTTATRQCGLSHARKIVPEDNHVDWHSWSASRALRTINALGKLWSNVNRIKKGEVICERVAWKGLKPIKGVQTDEVSTMAIGKLYGIQLAGRGERVTVIKAGDGVILEVTSLGLAGYSANTSLTDAARILGQEDL